jgi:hypothetical protein
LWPLPRLVSVQVFSCRGYSRAVAKIEASDVITTTKTEMMSLVRQNNLYRKKIQEQSDFLCELHRDNTRLRKVIIDMRRQFGLPPESPILVPDRRS